MVTFLILSDWEVGKVQFLTCTCAVIDSQGYWQCSLIVYHDIILRLRSVVCACLIVRDKLLFVEVDDMCVCVCAHVCVQILGSSLFIPPPPIWGGGVYQNHFVCLLVRLSVVLSMCAIMSTQYLLNSSTFFFLILNQTPYGDVFHEVICHAEKLFNYLQCQGHSEGLCNQNFAIITVSSKLPVGLQPNLVW